MTKEETRFTLRINKELFEQVKSIAERENRSAAKQIEFMLKTSMKEYEGKRDK